VDDGEKIDLSKPEWQLNNTSSLFIGDFFARELENLPSNLRNLTLGGKFNQKLENLPNSLQSLILGDCFNQKLENLPSSLLNLTLGNSFNQKLENLPSSLRKLILGRGFNQKLENLPNSLQNLTLGYCFNQKLDQCIALPKLRNLTIDINYNYELPPLFNTTIIFVFSVWVVKKLYTNYENYTINKWKTCFYESINIK